MNGLFILIASGLVLTALGFIVPPLWRQRPLAPSATDERNIAIAKHRLTELKEQLQLGALSDEQYAEQLAELEQALSDDLNGKQTTAVALQSRLMVVVLLIALPTLAVSLYALLGNFAAINPTAEMLGTAENQNQPSLADIEKMVAKLAQHAKANPDDAQAWLMLGKSYQYLQQSAKAADAFAQAYRLVGEQSDVMLAYAEALAFTNNEQLTGKPSELVFKVLAKEPDNIKGLWLAGMAKAQAGDTTEAKKLWQKLVALLPEGSPERQETQQLLAQLGDQLPTEPSSVAAASVELKVDVSLAADLQKSTRPNDTVFIYAQAENAKMPLAIVRKQVADLPLSVTLTDVMAMMPTMKLSNFTAVKLLARVSKSGNAMTQTGDLIGSVEAVATSDKTSHALIINGIAP